MRYIFIILIVILSSLQYKLWLGEGSILADKKLETKIQLQTNENQKLLICNKKLENDTNALKNGNESLEEQARYELGMVRNGETYYQFIE